MGAGKINTSSDMVIPSRVKLTIKVSGSLNSAKGHSIECDGLGQEKTVVSVSVRKKRKGQEGKNKADCPRFSVFMPVMSASNKFSIHIKSSV